MKVKTPDLSYRFILNGMAASAKSFIINSFLNQSPGFASANQKGYVVLTVKAITNNIPARERIIF